jgi:hypothetical protein
MADDKEVTFNRVRAFNDKEEELKKQGKSAWEAHQGASEHLAMLQDRDPKNYLRKKDRKARRKAAKAEKKERKAREQAGGGG